MESLQTESQKKKKVLVVDDEESIVVAIKDLLSREYDVITALNGAKGVDLAQKERPDVIIMDVMMSGMSGIEACEALRKNDQTRHISVLMLTGLNTSKDKIRAFDRGADDFMTKPFDMEELLARVRSKIRRSKELREPPQEVITIANLTLYAKNREVKIDDQVVELSPSEYGILYHLVSRPSEVVSRKEMMALVWEDGEKNDRLLDCHIAFLRKKISSFLGEIQTLYGLGYRIKAKPVALE